MSTLAPQLEKISVDPNKLFLDPNNPRLFTKEEEKVPLVNVTDPGVQDRTTERIFNDKDTFNIKELIQAILISRTRPKQVAICSFGLCLKTADTSCLKGIDD